MKLSILYVNYKAPRILLDSLDSLYQFDTQSFEIIVIDNNSNDGTEQLLKEAYPTVKFIQMGYNAGFARANNAGIKAATGEVILLLNTDTINLDDAVNRCFQQFILSDDFACSAQLLNTDNTPQISGNYVMKGGINNLLPLPYLGRWLRFVALQFSVKKPNLPEATGIVTVDWINGAFLMVKKDAIEKAGLLDEDFFLYAEEAEWCSRIRKYGKLSIYGEYKVMHLQGETANMAFGSAGKGYFNVSDRKGLQMMLSNFLRIRKEFGVGWFVFHFAVYLFDVPLSLFAGMISYVNPFAKNKFPFSQWMGFAKNMLALSYYFPKIILNRPYFYKVL